MRMLKLSGKLFLGFVATSVVSFISMKLFLSAEIASLYKVLLGVLFIGFILIIAWNGASNAGERDTKENSYNPVRGFLSALIAMIPALILAILLLTVSYHGWEKNNYAAYEAFYLILYLVFLPYSPLLATFVSYNPALSIDFAQPAITDIRNITTPNAVSAPMFFIPIAAFVIVAGIGYIYGSRERRIIIDSLKRLKSK